MNKQGIMESLEKEGFIEIDSIDYSDKVTAYNFFYLFDEEELDAAKDYANDGYKEENGEDSWYEEFFLPYLTELAGDNVSDLVEELCLQYSLEGDFAIYEMDRARQEQCEFTVVFAEKGTKFDIEKLMDELEL